MSFCWDRDRHEREGRDAARYRDDYGYEHEEKMRQARWNGPDSCERAYAEGYERERRYMEEQRREEQKREEYEMRRAAERAAEERAYEDAMWEAQMQADMEAEQQRAYDEELRRAEAEINHPDTDK